MGTRPCPRFVTARLWPPLGYDSVTATARPTQPRTVTTLKKKFAGPSSGPTPSYTWTLLPRDVKQLARSHTAGSGAGTTAQDPRTHQHCQAVPEAHAALLPRAPRVCTGPAVGERQQDRAGLEPGATAASFRTVTPLLCAPRRVASGHPGPAPRMPRLQRKPT